MEPVDAGQVEREAGVRGLRRLAAGVVLVELGDLLVDLGRGDVAGAGLLGASRGRRPGRAAPAAAVPPPGLRWSARIARVRFSIAACSVAVSSRWSRPDRPPRAAAAPTRCRPPVRPGRGRLAPRAETGSVAWAGAAAAERQRALTRAVMPATAAARWPRRLGRSHGDVLREETGRSGREVVPTRRSCTRTGTYREGRQAHELCRFAQVPDRATGLRAAVASGSRRSVRPGRPTTPPAPGSRLPASAARWTRARSRSWAR